MRQWIREHPWRLEIVPLIPLLYVALAPIIFGRAMVKPSGGWHGFAGYQEKLLWFGASLLMMLALTIIAAGLRHELVHIEPRKRSSAWSSSVPLVSIMALCGLGFLQTVGSHLCLTIGAVMVASCPFAQMRLEKCAPFVPRQTAREPMEAVADILPGESFFYREWHPRWSVILALPLIAAANFFMVWNLSGRKWIAAAVCVVPLLLLRAGWSKFIVSSQRIFAKAAWGQYAVPVSSVTACEVIDYEPWTGEKGGLSPYRDMILVIPEERAGRYLLVGTVEGKKYLLGLNRPQTACALINAALTARQKEAEA